MFPTPVGQPRGEEGNKVQTNRKVQVLHRGLQSATEHRYELPRWRDFLLTFSFDVRSETCISLPLLGARNKAVDRCLGSPEEKEPAVPFFPEDKPKKKKIAPKIESKKNKNVKQPAMLRTMEARLHTQTKAAEDPYSGLVILAPLLKHDTGAMSVPCRWCLTS